MVVKIQTVVFCVMTWWSNKNMTRVS